MLILSQEANSDLKRSALAYLQTFLAVDETTSSVDNEVSPFKNPPTRSDVAKGEESTIHKYFEFRRSISNAGSLALQRDLAEANILENTLTVLFYCKYTWPLTFENLCQAVQNEDFARASEFKAKRDTILTRGGESQTSATISSSASSRLLPAPPKCIIGLELTAKVPRQIGMCV